MHNTNSITKARIILQIKGIPKIRIHPIIKRTFPNAVKSRILFSFNGNELRNDSENGKCKENENPH